MKRVSSRRFYRTQPSVLFILVSFTVIISLSGTFDTVFAAEDSTNAAKASQPNSLEIPGSFKDLPEAVDAVTAKRAADRVPSVTSASGQSSTDLQIDSEKVSRPGSAAKPTRVDGFQFEDSELVEFHATAYCLKGRTASGINTRPGVIAADPSVLPLGTVVHLRAGRYTGTYTVLDTGGRIKGRRVDVYVPTHREAMEFGRQKVKIKVIGRGSSKGDNGNKNLIASDM